MKNVTLDSILIPLGETDLREVKGGFFGLLTLPILGFVSGYIYQKYIY